MEFKKDTKLNSTNNQRDLTFSLVLRFNFSITVKQEIHLITFVWYVQCGRKLVRTNLKVH